MKNNKNKNEQIIYTEKGDKCISPCFPPNTLFYNPKNLSSIIESEPSCAIKPYTEITKDIETSFYYGKCNIDDINDDYKNFHIFNDKIDIFHNDNSFLENIYDISDLYNLKIFLNDLIDDLPIYTQRRLLKSIFNVYYDFADFPRKIFIEKVKFVLENIYKIKLSFNIISEDLNAIQEKNELYNYFVTKYNKVI